MTALCQCEWLIISCLFCDGLLICPGCIMTRWPQKNSTLNTINVLTVHLSPIFSRGSLKNCFPLYSYWKIPSWNTNGSACVGPGLTLTFNMELNVCQAREKTLAPPTGVPLSVKISDRNLSCPVFRTFGQRGNPPPACASVCQDGLNHCEAEEWGGGCNFCNISWE